MSANIEELVRKHSRAFSGDVRGLRNALTEQAEAFKGELQAYDGMVRELTKTVEDMQAAQSAPVVGDVTLPLAQLAYERAFGESEDIDFCLRIARNVAALIQPTNSIHAAELATLREKAAQLEQVEKERDEANARLHDVSVACATAEQERDELRKEAERLQYLIDDTAIIMYSLGPNKTMCRLEWPLSGFVQDAFYPSERAAIDAAIAQEKGE